MLIELNREQIDYLLQLAHEDRHSDWTINDPPQADLVDSIMAALEDALKAAP